MHSVTTPDDWMIVLSGPLTTRGPLLAALTGVWADVENQPLNDPSHGLGHDDPTVGWITARHPDLNEVTARAVEAGWQLRAHWPTPRCQACAGDGCAHCAGSGRSPKPAPSPEQQLQAAVANLQARIAELENKGA